MERSARLRPACRLIVTHTPMFVESKLPFDGSEPSRSCYRDTAAGKGSAGGGNKGRDIVTTNLQLRQLLH